MSCPICKKRQISMLEKMVAIDRILFPKSSPQKRLSEVDLNLYKKTKHALLVNLYEVYKNLDHVSENVYTGENPVKEIQKYSSDLGISVFNETAKFIRTKEVVTELNKDASDLMLSEKVDFNVAAKRVILKNFLEIALDKLMLEKAIKQSDVKLLEISGGEILLNAHKSFRNDLIKLATK